MTLLIIFVAKYLFFVSILLASWFFLILPHTSKKKFTVFTLAAFIFSFALAKLLGAIFNDPRPFVSDHITPLIAHTADNGFPSDHTLLTMTIASVVFVYHRKLGILLALVAFLVGYARVLAGIHHVVDIIGAMVIAIAAVAIVKHFMHKSGNGRVS